MGKRVQPDARFLAARAEACSIERRRRPSADDGEVHGRSAYEAVLESYVWALERAIEGVLGCSLTELREKQDQAAKAASTQEETP